MARDSHTISRFHGINAVDSPMNIKPFEALSCLNVIATPSGELWQARDTTPLISFPTLDPTLNLSRILSLGLLDDQEGGHPPRLVIQQGDTLLTSDAPDYPLPALTTGKVLAGVPARLSYAQSASVLYFSNRRDTGKLLPGDPTVRNWGIAQPLTPPIFVLATTTMLGVVSIQRIGGVTILQFATPHGSFPGDPVYVDSDASATWDPSFSGLYPVATMTGPSTLTYAQPGLPDSGPWARAVFASGLTITDGYQYRFSSGFTETAHWSTASALSLSTGPLTSQSPVLLLPAQPDPQVDRFSVFRNLDGGGDWYLEGVVPVLVGPFAGRGVYLDTISDDILESSAQTPPYDNGVAPKARYLLPTLDRILACGIDGDNSVYYSGYDSINYGRPQESWPFFNRLKIGEGQSAPNGIGMTRYGAVIFTANSDLFIVRGSLSDVTVDTPTPPSFKVTQFPFGIACYSHFSIQPSSSGLIFVDDAFRLMLFDGYYEPQPIASLLSSILKRITPGSQEVLASTYVKLEDRQWYILSIPVDGSLQNNLTIVVDRTTDEERNTGVWITTLSLDDMVLVLNRDGTRHLLCAESQRASGASADLAGWVTEFPLFFSATDDPATLLNNASWRSGYFGIKDEDGLDEFEYVKTFRYLQLGSATDDIQCQSYLVDRDFYGFDNPLIIPSEVGGDTKGDIGMKGRAASVELLFTPSTPAPVTALTVAWNLSKKR